MKGTTRHHISHTPAMQFIRFLAVGCMNTLVTLLVIFLLKSAAGINPYIANATGYVAGLINSFIWNRIWVFHSAGHRLQEAARFFVGFGLCYMLQFAVVWFCTECTPLGDMLWDISFSRKWHFTLSGYGVATLTGMAVYTVMNFIYNRMVTFRQA